MLSAAQRRLWDGRDGWVGKLHGQWRGNLSRQDCEEVITDAILSSRLARRAREVDGALLRQWWAYDVRNAAINRDTRIRGARRKDGTRRGHNPSLDDPGNDGLTLSASIPSPDVEADPAEVVTEGLLEESRRYRREQATVICATALAQMKPKYQAVMRAELEGSGLPQRVLCQQLGLTEKAYYARLKVAKAEFGRRVRGQTLGPGCDDVRRLLGQPLGSSRARVEAHLEDCYPCRAWQLFHREAAAAAVLPLPLLSQLGVLTSRAHSAVTRTAPATRYDP